MSNRLDVIDGEIEECNKEYAELIRQKQELTRELDAKLFFCEKRQKEFKRKKEETFLELHPTLYVIKGAARARGNRYNNYCDFDSIIACFTTEDAAKEALGSKKEVSASHHDISYSVRVEATVNIPKNILERIDSPPERWLEYSP